MLMTGTEPNMANINNLEKMESNPSKNDRVLNSDQAAPFPISASLDDHPNLPGAHDDGLLPRDRGRAAWSLLTVVSCILMVTWGRYHKFKGLLFPMVGIDYLSRFWKCIWGIQRVLFQEPAVDRQPTCGLDRRCRCRMLSTGLPIDWSQMFLPAYQNLL